MTPEQRQAEFNESLDALIVQVRLFLWGIRCYLRLDR